MAQQDRKPASINRLVAACFALAAAVPATLPAPEACAADFAVVSVIRAFPMKGGEDINKDYYVNAGANNGLLKGAYIEAMRKTNVHDNISSKVIGDTPIPIARLKLIHVDKNVAIARLVKFYEKSTTPETGYDDVMVGDLVRVADKQ